MCLFSVAFSCLQCEVFMSNISTCSFFPFQRHIALEYISIQENQQDLISDEMFKSRSSVLLIVQQKYTVGSHNHCTATVDLVVHTTLLERVLPTHPYNLCVPSQQPRSKILICVFGMLERH